MKWIVAILLILLGSVALPANAPHPYGALLFVDYLLSSEGQKLLGKFGLGSAMNRPTFKRWYAEAGMTVDQYDRENEKWEKLLRDIGKIKIPDRFPAIQLELRSYT